MKKKIKLSLKEKLLKMDLLTNQQQGFVLGGTEESGETLGNPTFSFTPPPTTPNYKFSINPPGGTITYTF